MHASCLLHLHAARAFHMFTAGSSGSGGIGGDANERLLHSAVVSLLLSRAPLLLTILASRASFFSTLSLTLVCMDYRV